MREHLSECARSSSAESRGSSIFLLVKKLVVQVRREPTVQTVLDGVGFAAMEEFYHGMMPGQSNREMRRQDKMSEQPQNGGQAQGAAGSATAGGATAAVPAPAAGLQQAALVHRGRRY